MSSGSKDSSIFTGNPTGDGKSAGIVDKKIGRGQTLKSAYPQDNVHGMSLSDEMGGSFGGSDTDLSHSLKGASAVQDSKGKPESSGI